MRGMVSVGKEQGLPILGEHSVLFGGFMLLIFCAVFFNILGVPNLHHQHNVVLIIFTFF